MTLTHRAADTQLDLAHTVFRRLPSVWGALATGRLDIRRAKVIADGTDHLPETTARAVVEMILPDAVELTTGQIAARLRQLCIEVDPDQAAAEYEIAVADRHVELRPNPDGTAYLAGYDLPPDRASRVMSRINRIAESLRTGDETRTMDQLRADVFLDLLDGGKHAKSAKKGIVDIHVDLETLTRLTETPGELAGYGPVIADIARQVPENGQGQQWRYQITNQTGDIIDHGITRRRPTGSLRRTIETHHPTCVTRGCRAPATASDLDHTQPWVEGGETSADNLGPNCPHDHYVRHRTGWTYQRAANGDHIWTSPLGHTYTNDKNPP